MPGLKGFPVGSQHLRNPKYPFLCAAGAASTVPVKLAWQSAQGLWEQRGKKGLGAGLPAHLDMLVPVSDMPTPASALLRISATEELTMRRTSMHFQPGPLWPGSSQFLQLL